MNLDLDKEMDAILRKARHGTSYAENAPQRHLDADDISAFAENALPDRTRSAYMTHLAECDPCRNILRNTIELNAEAGPEPEIIYAPAAKQTAVPWYRRLALFPQLAYVLGGLVIIFAGFIGYSVLQNGSLGELSRSGETLPGVFEPATASNTSANAAMASNAPAVENTAMEVRETVANTSAANTNSALPANTAPRSRELEKQAAAEGSEVSADRNADELETAAAAPPPATRSENYSKDVIIEVPPASAAPEKPSPTLRNRSDDRRETGRVMAGRPNEPKAKTEAATGSANAESQSVGGKRFERKQRVWYDSAYGSQATTNIKRGSAEYRKLDRGLRSIAESLSGTVVVVWNGKAYRIQ